MRKLIALICAIAMVMALAVPAFAAWSPIDPDINGGETIDEVVDEGDDDDDDDDGEDETAEEEAVVNPNAVNADLAALAEKAWLQYKADHPEEVGEFNRAVEWLIPSLDVLKAELAKSTASELKVVTFNAAANEIKIVALTELFAPDFALVGVDTDTIIAK